MSGKVWSCQREVIRSRNSKKNRQQNGQKKKDKKTNIDLQINTFKTIDRATCFSLKTWVELQCSGRWAPALHMWHTSCYYCYKMWPRQTHIVDPNLKFYFILKNDLGKVKCCWQFYNHWHLVSTEHLKCK